MTRRHARPAAGRSMHRGAGIAASGTRVAGRAWWGANRARRRAALAWTGTGRFGVFLWAAGAREASCSACRACGPCRARVGVSLDARRHWRRMVHAARSTQHAARSPQHAARSTKHEARSTKHEARSTKHEARSTKHEARSTKHEARSGAIPRVRDRARRPRRAQRTGAFALRR
ncbi:conserved hypothetical protein [Burkholderia pseudomallei Pasteur 52237]|nr:conserved hypothetical protein [Burkholderia pseudomallei Pasteur 52237]